MTQTRPDSRKTLRGVMLLSVAVLMLSVMDAISKYLTRFYPVTNILWVRFLVHTLFIVTVVGSRHGLRFIRTSRPAIQVLRGVLLPVSSLLFVLATKHMPIAEATAIAFVAPLLVTLLAVVFLKERVERAQWLAILFGFVGVLIIIRPGGEVFAWASLLPIANAATLASYQVLTRRVAGLENVYTSIFYPGLVGVLALSLTLPYAWVAPQSAFHFVLLGLVGIIGAASHLIMIRAYEHASASRLAPFSYSQMIWATALGYVVFGNFPDRWSLLGIAILAGSGIYIANGLRHS